MKALDYAVKQVKQVKDETERVERDEAEHLKKHTGDDAERRVALIRGILNKADD